MAADRWGLRYPAVDWARLLPLLSIPVLVVLSFWRLVRTLVLKKTYAPHLWSIGLFLLVSIYPYLVPYQLTIHEAAAAPNSQRLLLVGAVILLPLILGYTAYVHWICRGKVKADAGYH